MRDAARAAAPQSGPKAVAEIIIDLPAQPLPSALDAYSAATGLEVFYDGSLAQGRRSGAVKGLFTREAALRALLEGTGAVARSTGARSFTISPATTSTSLPRPSLADSFEHYFAVVQASVSHALCERVETRPGHYRAVMTFRVEPTGALAQPALVASTGDPVRDQAFLGALRALRIGESPPIGMRQPITMAVLPRGPAEPTGCGSDFVQQASDVTAR